MVDKTRYDVDAEPEREPRTTDGKLITSAYVTSKAECDALDPSGQLGERYEKFVSDFRSENNLTEVECWVTQVLAPKVINEETGDAAVFSQFVRTVNKKGSHSNVTTPNILAAQYRTLVDGLTASPLAVGTDRSLVGSDRIIHFEEHTADLGRGFKKDFRLWPVRILTDEEFEQIETRTFGGNRDKEDIESDSAAATAPAPSEAVAAALIAEALNGKSPADMLGAILNEERLKNVSSVYGVDLMEAATDESLADLLVNKGVMVLNGGILAKA